MLARQRAEFRDARRAAWSRLNATTSYGSACCTSSASFQPSSSCAEPQQILRELRLRREIVRVEFQRLALERRAFREAILLRELPPDEMRHRRILAPEFQRRGPRRRLGFRIRAQMRQHGAQRVRLGLVRVRLQRRRRAPFPPRDSSPRRSDAPPAAASAPTWRSVECERLFQRRLHRVGIARRVGPREAEPRIRRPREISSSHSRKSSPPAQSRPFPAPDRRSRDSCRASPAAPFAPDRRAAPGSSSGPCRKAAPPARAPRSPPPCHTSARRRAADRAAPVPCFASFAAPVARSASTAAMRIRGEDGKCSSAFTSVSRASA